MKRMVTYLSISEPEMFNKKKANVSEGKRQKERK